MFPYQIGIIGDAAPYQGALLKTLNAQLSELGLNTSDIKVLIGDEVSKRDPKAPFAAVFFGYVGANIAREPQLAAILKEDVVLLPVVPSIDEFTKFVPKEITHINGLAIDADDPSLTRVASFFLESFRLLRRERRIFISYKRSDCALIAAQLYDELDSRGYDVFLDTRGVPPGRDFQSVLWHRLADSDVVVMLDTPHFFESRWTEEEVARANTTSIQVLQVLWPGRDPTPASSLSSFHALSDKDFVAEQTGDNARLADSVARGIAVAAESLRARALAARHRYLINGFCDQANELGLKVDIQPSRHIVLQGKKRAVLVIPVVGVPTALRLHEVHRELDASKAPVIWALYDERGLLEEAIGHLEWLNTSLPLRAIKVYDVGKELVQESKP